MMSLSWFNSYSSCKGKSNDSIKIESPDHKIVVNFNLSLIAANAQYCIQYGGRKIIDTSLMGLMLKDDKILGEDVTIGDVKYSSFSGSWKPLYGEHDKYPD